MNQYEGIVEEIVYQNAQTGYTVCALNVSGASIAAVGKLYFVQEGETLRFDASWKKHPQYGEQLHIEHFEKVMPTTRDQIEEYLSCGIIKGIGLKLSQKIVRKFGEETLNVLRFNPEKLCQIKGISNEQALAISNEFETIAEMNHAINFLNQLKIPLTVASRLTKNMKGSLQNQIVQNPYILTQFEYGLSFKQVDEIAKNLDYDMNSQNRFMSLVRMILFEASTNGHTFLFEDEVYEKSERMAYATRESVENAVFKLAVEGEIYLEKISRTKIYLHKNYAAEQFIAQKILYYSKIQIPIEFEAISKQIKIFEEEEKIVLESNQIQSIHEALQSTISIITGGPGTGKTTIIKAIIELLERAGQSCILTAPTGRAARRMTESTGRKALTIHRLLEYEHFEGACDMNFARNERNPISSEVVIIDEASMVDVQIMAALLRAIEFPTRIVIVGDCDQLPSVGPGNVLRDLIDSNLIKTVRLTQIFRQTQESMIVVNAHKINSGMMPGCNLPESDFYFIPLMPNDALPLILDLYQRRLPNRYGFVPTRDIQVITPTRKGPLGVVELNKELQRAVNPPLQKDAGIHALEKKVMDKVFRVGDKVMQIRNNYTPEWQFQKGLYMQCLTEGLYPNRKGNLRWDKADLEIQRITEQGQGVFNGDTGVVVHIDKLQDCITVVFDDDREVVYENENVDQLEHAYCITVHKSQGSEFPAVIIPLFEGPKILYTRSLLYTAVTRAKKLSILVGTPAVLSNMVSNDIQSIRYSSLKDYLRE